METSVIGETDEYAWEHMPEGYFTKVGFSYKDVNFETLEDLGIADLRFLAYRLGVYEPLSKTQDEIIADIYKIGEVESK